MRKAPGKPAAPWQNAGLKAAALIVAGITVLAVVVVVGLDLLIGL